MQRFQNIMSDSNLNLTSHTHPFPLSPYHHSQLATIHPPLIGRIPTLSFHIMYPPLELFLGTLIQPLVFLGGMYLFTMTYFHKSSTNRILHTLFITRDYENLYIFNPSTSQPLSFVWAIPFQFTKLIHSFSFFLS